MPKRALKVLEATTDQVERLHAAVEQMVLPLSQQHATRLQCRRGCIACCVDDLSVFEVEASVIQRHHAGLLANEEPHPAGRCAFLDPSGGACRIYAHRPYVCRTQGLPLRWMDNVDGEVQELRDICELNETAEPIETLQAESCWTLGPVETRLSALQQRTAFGARVNLRDLFRR